MTFTSSYATLEIDELSFNDILSRLEMAGVTDDYYFNDLSYLGHPDNHGPVILFGMIALIRDPSTIRGEL